MLSLYLHRNDLNIVKVKSLKSFAKTQTQKLNQQKLCRIPLYNVSI